MKKSPTLLGYSMLLTYIKAEREAGSDLKTAIDKAVMQCLEKGYLTDFLRKHGGEVTGMLFKEITSEEFAEIRAEEAARLAREEAFAEGKAEGEKHGITKGRAEGRKEEKRTIAKAMKASAMEIGLIAQLTGLTIDEIEGL